MSYKGKHLFPSIKQEYQCRCIQVTEQNRKQVELLLQGKIIDTPGHTADLSVTVPYPAFCGAVVPAVPVARYCKHFF